MIAFDAQEIEHWANSPDARHQLPTLIRRLILATVPAASLIDMPGGSSVWKPGWDGLLEARDNNPWVPHGKSAWEFSVESKPHSKATDDYDKRTSQPLGIDRESSVFVFITPRVWSGKRKWEGERRQENKWSEVRAYDADDLAAWLEQAPGVADWFSRLIGKLPDSGFVCLNDWWEHWSTSTNPAILPELVIAGRSQESDKVRDWLIEPASSFYFQADTRDEAIAFTAATSLTATDRIKASFFARAVVVETPDAWRSLERSNYQMVLIRNFVGDMSSRVAVSKGHHVALPLDSAEESRSKGIELPRLGRDETIDALKSMGMPEHQARALSRKTARRLPVMRRRLLDEAGVPPPPWASGTSLRTLTALVLLGQWSEDKKGDKDAVARLAGKPYEEVERELTPLLNIADSPLTKIGHRWRYVSHEEAWHILAPYLTPSDATEFEKLAVEILSRESPAFDLPIEERLMAGIKGKVLPHSGTLVDGIARALALVGTQPERMRNVQDAPYIPGRIVRRVLVDGSDWRTWGTLGRHLVTLAEAAPVAFLDAVEKALDTEPCPFTDLFDQDRDPMFGGTPHTGLLWGLECLAWSKDCFSRVAVLLARLAELDPGGKVSNRPSTSLTELFYAWISLTDATDEHRLQALSMLIGRNPAVAWSALVNAFPSAVHNGIVLRNPPLWQPWGQDGHSSTTYAAMWHFADEMVRLLVDNAGVDASRWRDLVSLLTAMPQAARQDILQLLIQRADSLKQDAGAEPLRKAIRMELHRHRCHPDASWAMPSEDVDALDVAYRKLEPSDPIQAYSWMFESDWIDLPDGERPDYEENREHIAVAQREALRTVFESGGADAVLDLIDNASSPYVIGKTVVACIDTDEAFPLVLDCIQSEQQKRVEFAMNYFNTLCRQSGWALLDRAIEAIKSDGDFKPEVLGSLYISAGSVDLEPCLQRLESEDQSIQDVYWKGVNWLNLEDKDIDGQEFSTPIRRLLDVGRSVTVAQLIGSRAVSDELIIRTLSQIPKDLVNGTDAMSRDLSYIFSQLFERLDKSENVPDEVIAKLEVPYIVLIGRHRPNLAYHREVLRKPSLFADLITWLYKRADGKAENVLDERTREAQVGVSFEVLSSLRGLPGLTDDGSIDAELLTEWISEVRRLCAERDRKDIGDQKIGEVLANAPVGANGIWPCEPVRDLFETLPSREHIGLGFQVGRRNQRGVTSREIHEGGAQERKLAAQYREYADKCAVKWPFTHKLLRGIAYSYESDARREDTRAEWTDEAEY